MIYVSDISIELGKKKKDKATSAEMRYPERGNSPVERGCPDFLKDGILF